MFLLILHKKNCHFKRSIKVFVIAQFEADAQKQYGWNALEM